MKKLWVKIGILAGILLMLMSFNTLAARKTELPVKLINKNGYTYQNATINYFYVNSVENLYGKYQNRIYYSFGCEGEVPMKLCCYDASGYLIKSLPFYKSDYFIDVPDTTATVEIVPENASSKSESFYYRQSVNVYAPDGRIMEITDLQLPVYKMVGWSDSIYMYASDGRRIEISPFLVEEYQKVGWYTFEDYSYIEFSEYYYQYLGEGNNLAIIDLCNQYQYILAGTVYEANIYAFKTAALDRERIAENAPLVAGDSYITGSGSSKEAEIIFYNLSYKEIIALRLTFDYYNVFSEKLSTDYTRYSAEDLSIAPGERQLLSCDLSKADKAAYISNIKIIEVVFSDYTKWTNY